MRREGKLAFIKALAELDRLSNIRGEITNRLQEKLETLKIEHKELIILDLVEGASSNEEFIETIIKSLNIEEIINLINNRVKNSINSNLIEEIESRHYILVKMLLKLKMIDTKYSIAYIKNIYELFQKLLNQIWDYWNNPTHANYQDHIANYVFKNKSLADIMLIHIINIYRQDKDKSEDPNSAIHYVYNFGFIC